MADFLPRSVVVLDGHAFSSVVEHHLRRLPAAAGLANPSASQSGLPPANFPAFRKDKSWKSCPRK
jgi:hypothetical protein